MRRRYFVLILILITLVVVGCDLAKPQKRFRLAVPEGDYFYNRMSSHLESFLEKYGYEIEIVKATTSIVANKMVSVGEADLAFINNHSYSISQAADVQVGRLRTITPLATRIFLVFSKNPLPDTATAKELFENKRVGIELLNGEAQANIERLFKRAKISGTNIVHFDDNPDVIVFWGTLYGERAAKRINEGWHPFTFKQNWIEFLTLNDPSLRPFTLPKVPGDDRFIRINTIATEAILVGNSELGENAIYDLARVIFEHRLDLMKSDLMYRTIDESFDQKALLFPLHEGTVSFLSRNQPTFFERYSDAIALVLSITAVLYGAIQAIRNSLARRKKEQVDLYFLDFLEIRSDKSMSLDQKVKKLDSLFQRAVEQMTNEKLEKSDFHIISRLIQQELTMLKFHD
jgi:TRAP-type uncharacterized transport system substrate-binding protein